MSKIVEFEAAPELLKRINRITVKSQQCCNICAHLPCDDRICCALSFDPNNNICRTCEPCYEWICSAWL